ncbi:Anaerobic nitric oxide reductase transcription regulator NorR [Sporomusa carbonis]|uniref:sigma 54-interacting transcriptional regulator n=1 Tax=Sporomusa carbonis TaxID=3076075 RepID=UPI003A64AE8F
MVILAQETKEQFALDFDIREGLLEEAIDVAVAAEKDGYQAIISRGGTAAIIKQHVSIPVVEIKVTGYDVLRALYCYRDSDTTVAIVGYDNVVFGCRAVSNILHIPIYEYLLKVEAEQPYNWPVISAQVSQLLKERGITEVVGDVVAQSKLQLEHLNVHLITTGQEALLQAVDEAKQIVAVREVEKREAERLHAILNFVHDGVIATDEQGIVTLMNPVAEQIFNLSKASVVGKRINDVIPNTQIDTTLKTGVAQLEDLQKVPDGYILTNRVPIQVEGGIKGVVATFQEVTKIQHAEQKIRQNLYSKGHYARYSFDDIYTTDSQMKRLIAIAKSYARTDATILIQGESGTGKELLAQSIHQASNRANGPFVALNCSALPTNLLESELFGYVQGAFTGAKKGGNPGLFEVAHNGTIFLDEIGDIDKSVQSRLLRVLEEKQVMRLGSDTIIPVDIRIIAATNVNLKEAVSKGNFRLDLFYRLNILNLIVPPLRARTTDLKYLLHHFLNKYSEKYGIKIAELPEDVMAALLQYDWPGNIRELRNIAERIVLSWPGGEKADPDHLRLIIEDLGNAAATNGNMSADYFLQGSLQEIKQKIIMTVLEEEGHNKSRAARRLNIDRATLEKYL